MKKKLTFLLLVFFAGLSMNAADIADGYYRIKNASTGKYVECTGRIHAAPNVVDPSAKPGTIMEVASENGKLTVLRSQGVDVCHYMTRALTYVPDLFEYAADNVFGLVGEGELLGREGLDKLKAYFEQYKSSFSLHVEEVGDGYRLYYQLPSMNAVQRFYEENQSKIDYKLDNTDVDGLVNQAIEKLVNQVLKAAGINMTYQQLKQSAPQYVEAITYSAQKAYDALAEEGTGLVDPSTGGNAAFYKSVLSNSRNIFYFAREVSVTMVESFLGALGETSKFGELVSRLRSNAIFKKVWGAFKIVKPNGKYYLSDSGDEFTLVNEANTVIKNSDAIAIWELEAAESLTVELDEQFDGKYYTTLYVDFPFTVDGGTAYAVTSVKQDDGTVEKTALSSVAAQVPVLLESDQASVTIVPAASGTTPSVNILNGNEFLINELDIKTTTVSFEGYTLTIDGSVVTFGDYSIDLSKISQTLWNRYSYLVDRNSGTVNNKFFFGLSADDVAAATQTKTLAADEEKLFFDDYSGAMAANKAFIYEPENYIVELIEEEDNNVKDFDGYVRIYNETYQNYVNVVGRSTLEFTDDNSGAGTIIKIKTDGEGYVTELRSQGVDVGKIINRSLVYFGEVLEMGAGWLGENTTDGILGTTGLETLLNTLTENKNLLFPQLELVDGKYYLYYKFPTMQPVVDFYEANQGKIHTKLTEVGFEATVNKVIAGLFRSLLGHEATVEFHTWYSWYWMGNNSLPFPADVEAENNAAIYAAIQDYMENGASGMSAESSAIIQSITANKAKEAEFLETVLADKDLVWTFVRESALGIMEYENIGQKVIALVNSKIGLDLDKDRLMQIAKNIKPNARYYFAGSENGTRSNLDLFDNIINKLNANHGITDAWTLEEDPEYTVTFNANTEVLDEGNPVLLTTVYTDFAYTLPDGVTAYTVTGIETVTSYQYAQLQELASSGGIVAAQTPLLLAIASNGSADGSSAALTPTTESGATVSADANLLKGNDFLISMYEIKSPTVVNLFDKVKNFIGESRYERYVKQYEYLQMKNSGTVNNKFFFPLSASDYKDAYDTANKKSNVRVLSWDKKDVVGFWRYAGQLDGNKAFLYKDELSASDEPTVEPGDGVKAIRVSFGGDELDEATMIDVVETETIKDNTVYDLNGRRVKNPTRGIYVVNGKKVLIK